MVFDHVVNGKCTQGPVALSAVSLMDQSTRHGTSQV